MDRRTFIDTETDRQDRTGQDRQNSDRKAV